MRFRSLLLAIGCASSLLGLRAETAASAPSVLKNFITRDGAKLMDGDREFRFLGVNMPGMSYPYDYSLQIPERLQLPDAWELEDGFRTLQQMNTPVVRFHGLQVRWPTDAMTPLTQPVLAPGQFNEAAFRYYDQALALANRYGIRIIFSLTVGAGTYSDHRRKPKELFYTDPQLIADYQATVRHVLNRVNPLTGVPYREDKAVLAWQLGNELGHKTNITRDTLATWEGTMAAFIKSLDPNHLVMSAAATVPLQSNLDPNLDIYSRHYYGTEPVWSERLQADLAIVAKRRPFIVGEFGPYSDFPEQAGPMMKNHHAFLDALVKSDATGALLWSLYFHHRDGGFWWHQIMTFHSVWSYHWPGFPNGDGHHDREVLQSVRDAAFRIQGREPTPLPVPNTPELIPFQQVPMFSWRGPAGAEGYDIERAETSEGPWESIAENASDADVAYRPLFSDETARAGRSYFYRVIARNRRGRSAPSNVVGPVLVQSVRFVDELKDFSRVQSKTAGLDLDNEFNAQYAEYLYRARGKEGDNLVYGLPHALTSFFVSTWGETDAANLRIETSADGKEFAPVTFNRTVQTYTPPYMGLTKDQSHVRTDYTSIYVPPGHSFVRLVWQGPLELDRVELGYQNP